MSRRAEQVLRLVLKGPHTPSPSQATAPAPTGTTTHTQHQQARGKGKVFATTHCCAKGRTWSSRQPIMRETVRSAFTAKEMKPVRCLRAEKAEPARSEEKEACLGGGCGADRCWKRKQARRRAARGSGCNRNKYKPHLRGHTQRHSDSQLSKCQRTLRAQQVSARAARSFDLETRSRTDRSMSPTSTLVGSLAPRRRARALAQLPSFRDGAKRGSVLECGMPRCAAAFPPAAAGGARVAPWASRSMKISLTIEWSCRCSFCS